jgi:hypothetical protein
MNKAAATLIKLLEPSLVKVTHSRVSMPPDEGKQTVLALVMTAKGASFG